MKKKNNLEFIENITNQLKNLKFVKNVEEI